MCFRVELRSLGDVGYDFHATLGRTQHRAKKRPVRIRYQRHPSLARSSSNGWSARPRRERSGFYGGPIAFWSPERLVMAGYYWDPLDMDIEDDTDGDGKPDDLLSF